MLLFDHLLECTWDEDIDLGTVEVFFTDLVCWAFVSADATGFHVVLVERFAVDAVVVADRAGVVHDGDDLGAHVLEDLAGPAVYITETEE